MLINNRYQVLRPLGEGGFGQAYLVEDTQMPSRRKCVIKQLKPITTSPEIYQVVQDRFQREAAILEQLGENHPQIPRLYAYFSENQQFYLVQEWIEGETLDLIGVPQPESAVVSMLTSLLPVLDFIHAQGLIHRDLKPDNVILRCDTQQPVLIDFGAVRETMGTVMNSQQHPTSSIVIGTPGFMASEQAAGRPIPSSDLYSLALTAIYLLTGKMPQALASDTQTGELIWQQEATHVSPGLMAVLDKAVRSHPRDRYSSATEMLSAIAALPNVTVAPAPSVPSPGTIAPPTSQLKTMAVSPGADNQPSAQQSTVVSSQSSQTVVSNEFSGNSLLSSGSTTPESPWVKKLTPVTVGLLVALLGGGAIASGLLISRLSVDTTIQPLSSVGDDDASQSEQSAKVSSTVTSGDRTVQVAGEISSSKSSGVTEPPVEPEVPVPEFVEESIQREFMLRDASNEQVNVYELPFADAASPSYGVNGDIVSAIARTETNGIWYKVQFASGTVGWVPQSVISQVPEEPPTPSPDEPRDDDEPRDMETVPKYTELLGNAGERINVRSAPTTSASTPHYGVAGDPVQILSNTKGADGYDWYRVAFQSGAEGWVREDLIRLP